MQNIDPKEFWEKKIIRWEEGRYNKSAKSGPLEILANRSSASLKFRQKISLKLLSPFIKGSRIVEIGCGSGLLADRFIDLGAKSYVGFDIASSAIKKAKLNKKNQNISFEVASVDQLPKIDGDIIFSLGLLDWLDDTSLKSLFEISSNSNFFHSISEQRVSLQQQLHRIYVYLAYGHKTGSYTPRYFSIDQLRKISPIINSKKTQIYRDTRLSFGALISSLPISTNN